MWLCPYSFILDHTSLCLHCILFCVCFFVFGKTAITLALQSNGTIKMRSCSTMSLHQSLELLCVLCALYCCGGAGLAFTAVLCNGSHCLFWAPFAPCVVSGLAKGHLGFELSQIRHLLELRKHQTAGHFPCVVLWEDFLGGWGLYSDQMSALGQLLRLQSGWCVWFSSSLWGRRHFVASLAPVGAVGILPCLWHHFGWTSAMGVLEGSGCTMIARSTLFGCRKILQPGKTAKAGMEEKVPRGVQGSF